MPITRTFLGFDRPALELAADYLCDRYRSGTIWDLQRVIVVTPAGRAGRRLLEILVESASDRQLVLTPPTIETVGRLPEQLYPPQRPFANELTQRFAWSAALRSLAPETLRSVVPHPPDDDDALAWAELAAMLRQLHVELAGDGLAFSDVMRHLADPRGGESDRPETARAAASSHPDQQRWKGLAQLQAAYLRQLDDLRLWDRQTARLEAIKRRECATDRDIVVIGAVDMNVAIREMLDQVADQVVALVIAPTPWQDRFDAHGCLLPARWKQVDVPLDKAQVRVCDGPSEQATAVAQALAGYAGRYRADEITVGFPDEQLVPDVQRVLVQHDVPARWGPGRMLGETGPYLLLESLAGYLDRGRFQELAALARHPDVQSWLHSQGIGATALTEMDQYYNQHLPGRLAERWLGAAKKYPQLVAIQQAVDKVTRQLGGQPQIPSQWSAAVLGFFREVYGDRELDRNVETDQATLSACSQIRDAILELEAIPAALNVRLSACDAIRLVLGLVAAQPVPQATEAVAVELLGWLELPLDDAPALVVTTLNERYVPSSVTSDLFLPDSLRHRLGLMDNTRRYARDAYALCALLETREQLHLLVGRRGRDGDPLVPSRLLFTGDDTSVAERALTFFSPPASPSRRMTEHAEPGTGPAAPSTLHVPYPQPLAEPIRRMSVTSFRDYLACPYRFYLKHVRQLRSQDDADRELTPLAFGNLAHDVLRRFGESAGRQSSDVAEVRGILRHELDAEVRRVYGQHVLPFVRVQIEQLRIRLDAFAARQVEWVAEGWRIQHTEVPNGKHDPATIEVDGQPFELAGRIDRIDVHPETGGCVVFDYKTSDGGDTPEKTHQQAGRWTDLQLPLYRHLARSMGITGDVQLGFITLPKDTTQAGFKLAGWTETELAGADEVARDVVRQVRQQIFWPPTDPPPRFSEEFAGICQDGVFGKQLGSG